MNGEAKVQSILFFLRGTDASIRQGMEDTYRFVAHAEGWGYYPESFNSEIHPNEPENGSKVRTLHNPCPHLCSVQDFTGNEAHVGD